MDALLFIKRELDEFDKAIKAETTACAHARKAAAHTRAANESVREQLAAATRRAGGAGDARADLSALAACLEAQARERGDARGALQAGTSGRRAEMLALVEGLEAASAGFRASYARPALEAAAAAAAAREAGLRRAAVRALRALRARRAAVRGARQRAQELEGQVAAAGAAISGLEASLAAEAEAAAALATAAPGPDGGGGAAAAAAVARAEAAAAEEELEQIQEEAVLQELEISKLESQAAALRVEAEAEAAGGGCTSVVPFGGGAVPPRSGGRGGGGGGRGGARAKATVLEETVTVAHAVLGTASGGGGGGPLAQGPGGGATRVVRQRVTRRVVEVQEHVSSQSGRAMRPGARRGAAARGARGDAWAFSSRLRVFAAPTPRLTAACRPK
ncbi:MAG: hypothetical protein J3K34DRAFT_390723 [Monoraphidium minutum]|nr:MAG: hypothetical protein J3K34DRAFT_390723 [Monoraphidium minutum]